MHRKNIILGLSLLTLFSCKKDFTCQCSGTYTNSGETVILEKVVINDKEKEAKKRCEAMGGKTDYAGGIVGEIPQVEPSVCVILD